MGCGAAIFTAACSLDVNGARIRKRDSECSGNFEVMALVLSASVNRRGCIWKMLCREYSGKIQGARMKDRAPSFRVKGKVSRTVMQALYRELSW